MINNVNSHNLNSAMAPNQAAAAAVPVRVTANQRLIMNQSTAVHHRKNQATAKNPKTIMMTMILLCR